MGIGPSRHLQACAETLYSGLRLRFRFMTKRMLARSVGLPEMPSI